MKILITTEHFLPKINGVQVKTLELIQGFTKLGYDVTVFTQRSKNQPFNENINGVKVVRFNLKSFFGIYYGQIRKYQKYFQQNSYQFSVIINICSQNAFTDLLLKSVKISPQFCVIYFHGMAHMEITKVQNRNLRDYLIFLHNITFWRIYYLRNKNYFNSYNLSIHLHRKDPTFNLIKANRRKIISENFTQINIQKKIFTRDNSFLCLSNYFKDKNQEMVLKSFYMSQSHRKLCFVGAKRSKYLKRLKELKQFFDLRFGFKNVEFIVDEPRRNTIERIKNCHALLTASKSEKYPLILSESLSFLTPFISTDSGIVGYLPGGLIANNCYDFTRAIDLLCSDKILYSKLQHEIYDYHSKNHLTNFYGTSLVNKIISVLNEK